MITDELSRRLVTAARNVRKYEDWVERRDRLIVEAIEAGATQREVAKLVGLSQPSISAIVNRPTSPSN